MFVDSFTPYTAITGGLLIGLSISILLFFNGKVAGISSVLGGLFNLQTHDKSWRIFFLSGMIIGVAIWIALNDKITINFDTNLSVLILGGFLTGFGTQLSSGCTSGHGVFGIAYLSYRSIIATIIFVFFGITTVFFQRNLF
tara:strand:- start:1967 stop:2389 length:423 start_codon:yes stop_codon:yes gene_type:complete